MDPSHSFVSVVIPTFNRRDTLVEVIRPVLKDPRTGEIIVVVDGATDGTMELLTEWSRTEPRIKAVLQENSGEGVARRRGVEEARHNIVVLLDDDVQASDGLVSAHAKWHDERDHRLVLGYMPTRVPSPRRRGQAPTILYAQDYEGTCELYETDPALIFTNLWAGNMSMTRASALEARFGADVRLSYHEDLRFGLRCQRAGLEPIFDRSLLALHSHSRSLRQFALESRRSGEARARLRHEFPELAKDLDPISSLTPKEAMVARYLGAPAPASLVGPIAMAVTFVAGYLKMWRLETMSARLLRLVELSAGFKRYSRASRR
jgi:glycosyltransferase involved in cell wall biosynthesis